MQLPMQIKVRDMSISEAAETAIRERAAYLDADYDRIMSCRVVVEGPVRGTCETTTWPPCGKIEGDVRCNAPTIIGSA